MNAEPGDRSYPFICPSACLISETGKRISTKFSTGGSHTRSCWRNYIFVQFYQLQTLTNQLTNQLHGAQSSLMN